MILIRWEVGAGQWNPSQQYENPIAICCNDKVDIPSTSIGNQMFLGVDI